MVLYFKMFTSLCMLTVYQSLIRTCSHLPVIETENEGEVTQDDPMIKKITYKDFMDTWSGLLDAPNIKV